MLSFTRLVGVGHLGSVPTFPLIASPSSPSFDRSCPTDVRNAPFVLQSVGGVDILAQPYVLSL